MERVTKNGPRPLDVRAALVDLQLTLTRTARSGGATTGSDVHER